MGGGESGGVEEGEEAGVAIWSHLFKAVVALVRKLASAYSRYLLILNQVRQLHSRDTRHQFCPSQHWIQPRLALPLDRPEGVSFHRSRFFCWPKAGFIDWSTHEIQSRIRAYRPFRGLRVFTREELESSGPPLSTKEVFSALKYPESQFLFF